MRHRDDRALVFAQVPLEPCDGLRVEVVGRLVQEENVGFLQEQPAECDAAPLAARKYVHHLVGRRTAQGVHREFQPRVQVPSVVRVQFFLQLGLLGSQLVEVGVGIAVGLADGLELRELVDDLLHTLAHNLFDRLPCLDLRLLLQETDRVARRDGSVAEDLSVLPGEDAQEARLAGAVEADDADLGTVIVGKPDVLQDHFHAVPLGDAVHRIDDFLVVVCRCHDGIIAGKAGESVVAGRRLPCLNGGRPGSAAFSPFSGTACPSRSRHRRGGRRPFLTSGVCSCFEGRGSVVPVLRARLEPGRVGHGA